MFNNYLQHNYQPYHKILDQVGQLGSVYLGDINSALNLEFLAEAGILTVITAAEGLDQVSYPHSSITHIRYPLYDMQSERISRFFEDNYKNIEEGRLRGNVLIHCAAGVSRGKSATLLISYLMRKEAWSFKKAIAVVRDKRAIICPNLGFERQLKQYEKSILVRPRAYSIRFGPKSSDEPRSKNDRTSLPQIASTLNRTHLKISQLKELNIFANNSRKDVYLDRRLDLQHNLVVSSFKPHDKPTSKLQPYSSEQLESRKRQLHPLINSNELKRMTILKLGQFGVLQPQRERAILYNSNKRRPVE